MAELKTFDAAEYLDSHEAIAEYLTATSEDDNPEVFLVAALDVARALVAQRRVTNETNSRQNAP